MKCLAEYFTSLCTKKDGAENEGQSHPTHSCMFEDVVFCSEKVENLHLHKMLLELGLDGKGYEGFQKF